MDISVWRKTVFNVAQCLYWEETKNLWISGQSRIKMLCLNLQELTELQPPETLNNHNNYSTHFFIMCVYVYATLYKQTIFQEVKQQFV